MKLKLFGAIALVMIVSLWLLGESGPESMAKGEGKNRLIRAGSASMIPWEMPKPREMSRALGLNQGPVDFDRAAKEYLDEHRAEWEVRDYHNLVASSTVGPLGGRVTYSAYQDGMLVVGATIEMEFDGQGRMVQVRNNYKPVARLEMPEPEEVMTPTEVIGRAAERFAATEANLSNVTKVIFSPGEGGEAELGYVIPVKDALDSRTGQALFRASDGQLLRKSFSRSEF